MTSISSASASLERKMLPSEKIDIRKATPQDADRALELIDEYYQVNQVVVRDDKSSLLKAIASEDCGIWIATIDSALVGCVMLRPLAESPGCGEVKRLYVRPAYRKQKIAQQLMNALEDYASHLNMRRLYLDTKDDLMEAIRFYERNGYSRCARYNQNPQATIFMYKDLHTRPINIRSFREGDEEAFRLLNEAWISKYFVLEEKDRVTLGNPHKYILKDGGQILFAENGKGIVGCCALVRMEDGSFEVSKMAVAESERGQGIGRKVLAAIVHYAREQGIKRLYLETNSSLKDAIHLYEAVGFSYIPEERQLPSPYARADVFMDLFL